MVNNRGRVQLQFRLDDPKERAAFDAIQSAPQRGKTEFVTNCILACQNPQEERIAELVAEKVLALLAKGQPVSAPAEKRKRGRPPKRAKELNVLLTESTSESSKSNLALKPKPKPMLSPCQKTEEDDFVLDGDILDSMENFINAV